jgi:hypothetical protein
MRNFAPGLFLILFFQACWIPLPEDTAIIVEVLDSKGEPVDGVQLNLDGTETLTTGSQSNSGTGVSRKTKLGAFYIWSGYYYASTESALPVMADSSENVRHRDVFSFIESGIASADVMGDPFDSSHPGGYRQRTTALFTGALASASTTINNLAIFYNTDEDGQALVFPATIGNISGYAGNLRIRAVNKQPPSPKLKPYLQNKEFRMSYFTGTDALVTDPEPSYGGSIYYLGTLEEPDFEDPRW